MAKCSYLSRLCVFGGRWQKKETFDAIKLATSCFKFSQWNSVSLLYFHPQQVWICKREKKNPKTPFQSAKWSLGRENSGGRAAIRKQSLCRCAVMKLNECFGRRNSAAPPTIFSRFSRPEHTEEAPIPHRPPPTTPPGRNKVASRPLLPYLNWSLRHLYFSWVSLFFCGLLTFIIQIRTQTLSFFFTWGETVATFVFKTLQEIQILFKVVHYFIFFYVENWLRSMTAGWSELLLVAVWLYCSWKAKGEKTIVGSSKADLWPLTSGQTGPDILSEAFKRFQIIILLVAKLL